MPSSAMDQRLLVTVTKGTLGVLATLKRDGRPQLSHVTYCFESDPAMVRVSTGADRAKVANLRRDPRASLLVSSADGWSYTVLEGDAELSAVCARPDDSVVDELVEVYRLVRGEEHQDWAEYREAMVAERRLVVRLPVLRAYGVARG